MTTLRTLAARVRASRAALLADLRATVETGRLYRRETRSGAVTVTRSTRDGVAWQVTSWDRDGAPTGHVDAGSLEAAAGVVAGMGWHSCSLRPGSPGRRCRLLARRAALAATDT